MSRRLGGGGASSVLALSLGVGLGVGLGSMLYFGSLIVALSTTQIAILEGLAAITLLLLSKTAKPVASPIGDGRSFSGLRFLPFCTGLCLVGAVLSSICFWRHSPHGGNDAYEIWNLRARYLNYSLPDWRLAFHFDGAKLSDHLDYPPLIPLFIARCWRLLSNDTVFVPAGVALLYLLATFGVLLSTLWILRSKLQGFLAAMLLLCPSMIIVSADQYMDVPLSFYAVSAVCLLCLTERYAERRELVLFAGVFAGLAACTKNEGLLILLAIVAARGVVLLKVEPSRWRTEVLWFAAGLAPAILFLGYFKVFLAPPNDLVAGSSPSQILSRLLSWPRYVTVARAFAQMFWRFGFWWFSPFLTLAAYSFFTRAPATKPLRTESITSAAVYLFSLCGYFFVYVLTPNDLEWHLTWSLSRLFLQLWPVFLLTVFILARTPEEIEADRQTETVPTTTSAFVG